MVASSPQGPGDEDVPVSKVGAPLMGDTAVHSLSHDFKLNFIAEYVTKNTQFNMYTTTSKQQEGCTFEDSHPKCFITTNSTAKLSRGAVNRGDVHVLRASYTKVNSNTVCNYFNFI